MKEIYVITGQTATGKTNRAIKLAAKINGELISVDSRQVYKSLDIITGKDLELTKGQFNLLKSIKSDAGQDTFDIGYYELKDSKSRLWLVDITQPQVVFSAVDYRICAIEVLKNIFKRGRTPIFIGGSYLYLKHLIYGNINIFSQRDDDLRKKYSLESLESLQKVVQKLDSDLWNNLNNSEKHNPQRLIRKIEILTNKKTKVQVNKNLAEYFPDIKITWSGFRYENLKDRTNAITKRVYERLKSGAVVEVKILLSKGCNKTDPGLQTIGYSEIIEYLDGKVTLDQMTKLWINHEVQYAKRQYTFMKKNSDINWEVVY